MGKGNKQIGQQPLCSVRLTDDDQNTVKTIVGEKKEGDYVKYHKREKEDKYEFNERKGDI